MIGFGHKRPAKPHPGREFRPRQAATVSPAPVEAMKVVVRMRQKAGMSLYRLSADAHVDYNYLKKLESRRSRNPSRQVLIALGNALVAHTSPFSQKDVDRILREAGFPPAPARTNDTQNETEGPYAGRGNYGEFARPPRKPTRSGFSLLSLFSRKKDSRKKSRAGGKGGRR